MGRAPQPLALVAPVALCSALVTWSCTPEDSERCGDDYTYQDGMCQPLGDTDSSSDSDTDDAGADGGDELPSGMGEVCAGEEDCAGYEADYCLIQMGEEEGVCTIQDCSVDPDDCPDGYLCCDFSIPSVPNFCATDERFADLGTMCAE